MKYADAVKRSLRLIQVINPVQQVSDDDMQTGIQVLNSMLVRWEADGTTLGWSPGTSPDEELTIPDEAIEAVVYNLALRLCPEYGVQPMPVVIGGAQMGLAAIERDVRAQSPIINYSSGPAPANYVTNYNSLIDGPNKGWGY